MGVLRTFVLGLCLLVPAGASALPDTPLRTFANCAGRLSAVVEHQWLMRDPAADVSAAQRASMLDLIDAIMAPEQTRSVIVWRVEAKTAHAKLLSRATFNDDGADAAWALQQAEHHLAQCTGLLLS